MHDLDWLHEGADVTIVRDRGTHIERIPARAQWLNLDKAWGQVVAVPNPGSPYGGAWTFNIAADGLVGVNDGGVDACGFPTRLEPQEPKHPAV